MILAFCSIALPVLDQHLEPYGIIITEQDVMHMLAMFGISGGVGALNAAHKRKKTADVVQARYMAAPQLATEDARKEAAAEVVKHAPKAPNAPRTPFKKRAAQAPARTTPELRPAGAAYQTNFREDKDHGNYLPYGEKDLYVRYSGARTYVGVVVKAKNGNVIDVGQGHPSDEDSNVETVRLHLTDRSGSAIPRGSYILEVSGDRGSSYETSIKDEFEVR